MDSTWYSIIVTIITLVVILALMIWGSKWVLKKNTVTLKSKHIRIVDRVLLGQDKSIVLAKICDQFYILGISGQQITLLKELTDFELTEEEMTPTTFSEVFADSLKKQFKQVKDNFSKKGK